MGCAYDIASGSTVWTHFDPLGLQGARTYSAAVNAAKAQGRENMKNTLGGGLAGVQNFGISSVQAVGFVLSGGEISSGHMAPWRNAVDKANASVLGIDTNSSQYQTAKELTSLGLEVAAAKAAAGKPKDVTPTKTQLQINKENGAAFENVVENHLKAKNPNSVVQPQITLKTESGVSTRVDFVTKNPKTGQVSLTEAKSSATASLTTNQKKAFPEIETSGATVQGAGKAGVEGGTTIPPTKVEVVRPEDLE